MYLSQLDTLVGLASSYFMLIMAIRLIHSSTNPSILIHSDYNSSHTDIVSFIKCVFLFYNIPSWMKCLRARRRCLGKCDITVPKVDNNSVLTMENRNLSTQETYGIWKRPCEQRNVSDLLLYKTLCGALHKGKV